MPFGCCCEDAGGVVGHGAHIREASYRQSAEASASGGEAPRCPVSGVEMSKADLVEVKSSATASVVKPRVAEATSIPALLGMFQNEWDAVVLESATLKKSLDEARRELAQHLYQYDAACRVIARLKKERDEALQALEATRQSGSSSAAAAAAPPPPAAAPVEAKKEASKDNLKLPAADLEKIEAVAKKLSKARRRLPVPSDLSTPATIKEWKETHEHKPKSGCIHAVDVHPVNSDLIALGNDIGGVSVYNRASKSVATACSEGHAKAVTAVRFHPSRPSVLISGSQDCTAKVWKGDACVHAIRHEMDVTGVDVQATGDYVCTSSLRGDWKMSALESGSTLLCVRDEAADPFTFLACHPDGQVVATGASSGALRLYDIKANGAVVAKLSDHTKFIDSVSFSANGYQMASASADGCVRLWDLRKIKCVKSFRVDAGAPTCVQFDASGKYLACATSKGEARVRVVKSWEELWSSKVSSQSLTSCAFAPSAAYLATSSRDGALQLHSAQ